MGQSTVVGVAFTALIFIAGIASYITLNISSINLVNNIIPSKIDQINIIKNESFEITSWNRENGLLSLNITNTGNTKIAVKEFEKIDIILIYTLDETQHTLRLDFSKEPVQYSYWTLENVYYNGGPGDIMNPINISEWYGYWDPFEVIEIGIYIQESFDTLHHIIFSSPNGVIENRLLSREKDYGRATVINGSLNTTVSHKLNVTPLSIQVTPLNDTRSTYWVNDVNDCNFTISISNVLDYDVEFFWWASS